MTSLVLEAPPPEASLLPFQFLICIDFEATCDEVSESHPDLLVARDEQEIIEFPWVVLDTHTLEIVHKQQQYIKPEHTAVTEFCTNLTHITDEKLQQEGVTFQEAISVFSDFVNHNYVQENKTFCIVAHGKWDIAQLRYEAQRKGIELEPWMHSFLDLREIFRHWGRVSRKRVASTSLDSMCRALQIKFLGQEHSGIDDATNIASILIIILPETRAAILRHKADTVAAEAAITEYHEQFENGATHGSNQTKTDARAPREPRELRIPKPLPNFPQAYSWLESLIALRNETEVTWLEMSGLPYDASETSITEWLHKCLQASERQHRGSDSKANETNEDQSSIGGDGSDGGDGGAQNNALRGHVPCICQPSFSVHSSVEVQRPRGADHNTCKTVV